MLKPWGLFRFRAINEWLWKELTDCAIFHNAPQEFNDPFDCGVAVDDALARALNADLAPDRRAILEGFQRRFRAKSPDDLDKGVCCFTVNADNPLMWAHYADKHCGVCLLYEFPATYFTHKYPPRDKHPFFVGCEQVHYGDDAYTEWLASGDLHYPRPEPIENTVSRIFVTKAKCWEYEEEVRTVVSRSKWAMTFEPHFLKQVIFGLKTPEADKLRVAEIAMRNNSHVRFSQARISRDKDFRMEFLEARMTRKLQHTA